MTGVVIAHPLTESFELPVSPLFLSAVALCLLIAAVWLVGRRTAESEDISDSDAEKQEQAEPAGPAFWAVRVIALLVFVGAGVAALVGDDAELSNIAPALVMGGGWPLLVIACAALGPVWRWVNPFDTLGRVVAPLGAGDGTDARPNVVWALPAAVVWVAYLTMWPGHLAPRTIGRAMVIYTIVTLAGCLALGRRTWLSSGEVFTVFFNGVAQVRRRWTASSFPAGYPIVAGALCGGFLYGLLRDSQLLASIGYGPRSTLYSAIVVVATVAVVAGLAAAVHRRAGNDQARRALGIALTVAAVGLAVALGLARNRFTTSLQLLPVLASDPLGRDWNVFGTRDWILTARPLGIVGLLAVQLVVVVAAHVLAAMLAVAAAKSGGNAGPRAAAGAVQITAALLVVAVAAVGATAM